MDNFRQDSSYTTTSALQPGSFKPLTSQETATVRSWRRAVIVFYAAVLLGGFGVLVSIPVSNQQLAEVVRR